MCQALFWDLGQHLGTHPIKILTMGHFSSRHLEVCSQNRNSLPLGSMSPRCSTVRQSATHTEHGNLESSGKWKRRSRKRQGLFQPMTSC